MKQIYVKNSGKKVSVEVTDDQERVLTQTRRAIWNNDAQQRYYRAASLDAMTDHDERTSCAALNPETIYIAAEEKAERSAKLAAAIKTLTPEQRKLIVLLRMRVSGKEIAKRLNMTEPAVTQMKKRVQKKLEKFLREPR